MAAQPPVPPAPLSGAESVQSRADRALELQTTATLLELARGGQADALDALFGRCLPRLRRWARGRLPGAARDLLDTEDLVQETVGSVLRNLDHFESRHEGALQAYLRQAVLNRITGEARRVARRPPGLELDDVHPASGLSPLEALLGAEAVERYERALQRLPPHYREAIVARLELQCSYQDVALALGKPNANSARSLVVRALYRLHEEMNRG
jgi:RNA polymerase sigma-70 factor (ECF subfamily)